MAVNNPSAGDNSIAPKAGNKVYNENAKHVKILIDKKIANINPLTNIVEPAFNKFTSKPKAKNISSSLIDLKALRTGRTEIKLSKAQEEEMQEKLETHIINTIPGVDNEKFMQEKLAFVRELEDQYHQTNLRKENKEQEAKKGRKLRKEYTLPPKPIKGMPFYQMESKKYEAAKYYLLNQNSTTLSKTCKKFKVSVPTLITYMDKDRVEAFLKTGKYSGTAAKRERRNVKNQYKEKEQLSDKWVDTIKTLITETPGSEEGSTIIDKSSVELKAEVSEPPKPELTKREAIAAHHLEESKRIMKDTQVKFQSLRTSNAQMRNPTTTATTHKGLAHIFTDPSNENKIFLPPLKINKRTTSLKDVRRASPSENLMHLANLSSMNKPTRNLPEFGILSMDNTSTTTGDRGSLTFSRPGSSYFTNTFVQNGGYLVPPLTAGSTNESAIGGTQRMYFMNPPAGGKTFSFIASKASTLLSAGSGVDPVEGQNGVRKLSNGSPLETKQLMPSFSHESKQQNGEYYGVENIYHSVKNIQESNDRNEKMISPKEEVVKGSGEKQFVQTEKTAVEGFVFTPPNSGTTSKGPNQPEY